MTNVEKIRRVSLKHEASQMLYALEKLLELYRKREEHSIDCPLCANGECTQCPWRLFMGLGCGDYRDKHFPMYRFIYHNYPIFDNPINEAWRKRRLRQLPKWISYYKQALANWDS